MKNSNRSGLWLKTQILTHYHTMPHLDALQIYSRGKHYVKRGNCLSQYKLFLLFSQCFVPSMAHIFHFKCTLTLSQTSPACLQYKSFENTVGKGEIARNEQFLLFPQCFLPIWRTFCHFKQI